MKKQLIKAVLLLLLSISVHVVYGQPGVTEEPQDPRLPMGDPDGDDVPLDGGVLFLLAAGAAYGYIKLRENKQVSMD